MERPVSIRARGQLLPLVGVVLVGLATLGSAAANLIPIDRISPEQVRQDEQRAIVVAWRSEIAELRSAGDHCRPATAHQLVRLLVMNGDWTDAHAFADDYEVRCGEDPVVRHWGDAPRPPRGR